MRLLIYHPWDFTSGAAEQLRALVHNRGWQADFVSGAADLRRQLLLPAGGTARDFRELILCHERAAHLHRWQQIARRAYGAFIGFGGVTAPLAAALPGAWPKLAIVERLESEQLANSAGAGARLLFDLRIEADLLRTFNRVFASIDLAPRLAVFGLKDCLFDGVEVIERILANHLAA